MAKTKILIQDIADALNLSRTTVSKVLNNSGSVSPQTRERVLHKAAELNYKCYSLIQPVLTENLDLKEAFTAQSTDAPEEESAPSQKSQIAVFFSKGIDKQHIGFNLLSVLGQELSRKNYSISMYFIQEAEFQSLLLPPTFHLEQTASIFCICRTCSSRALRRSLSRAQPMAMPARWAADSMRAISLLPGARGSRW